MTDIAKENWILDFEEDKKDEKSKINYFQFELIIYAASSHVRAAGCVREVGNFESKVRVRH